MATKVVAVAHRKALLYVVHEVLKSKDVMGVEDRMPGCVRFLLMVGAIVSGFSEEEKRSYTRILSVWEKTQVFDHGVIARIKESWGM